MSRTVFLRRLWRGAGWAAVLACFAASVGAAEAQEKDKFPPYAEVTKDATAINGLIKLHKKGEKLLAEISPGQMNKDFLVLISIAQGVGEGQLLGGMSWGFGDDWVWQFRPVGDDSVHLVRKNVRFRAAPGSPEANAVKLAYTDSVLFALPIVSKSPGGAVLVDLGNVFLTDLPQIGLMLPGFAFDRSRSTWGALKGFPENVELEVSATYGSRGNLEIDTVPDSRGLTVTVHYSISQLPANGYKPRLADDRVGYFLTAVKDFSQKTDEERFVRYINRWDLQPADPAAPLSPPKEPIVFWIEKTVPFAYRKPIREGILEWNKAFEKAGFANAIEVRQQDDSSDWSPEDVHYNTFRWITAGAGFAMGPSRVNPLTGQILDADIIFDADFIQYWKHEYETLTPAAIAEMTGGPLDIPSYFQQQERVPAHLRHSSKCRCLMNHGSTFQMAFGSAVLATQFGMEVSKPMQEKLIMQGLKEVTMHEVGHTLGLRHNFKASSFLTLADLNDPSKSSQTGLTASVMDYAPVNVVPKETPQGDYYSQTIGPYDYWAIEYGYRVFSGNEKEELAKIAAKGSSPELAYATDEDTRGIDPDPLVNRWDLGNDPLAYAKQQATLVSQLWPDVVNRITKEGEGYYKARQAFGILLGTHGRAMFFAARQVGGLYVSRAHKGDPNAKAPLTVVEPAKQREALELVAQGVFSDKPFQFPPELYNHLAATRWSHWGMNESTRLDYPAHEVILMWQERVLDQLLSTLTLERLHDAELKVAADADAFTTAELIAKLTKSVFSETDTLAAGQYTERKPAISSLRRNLQRAYLKKLSSLALGETGAPEDCRTVAYMQLVDLQGKLKALSTKEGVQFDAYSRAHLHETIERIGKVIDARVTVSGF